MPPDFIYALPQGGVFLVILALFVIVVHDRPFVGSTALTPQPILRAAGAAP